MLLLCLEDSLDNEPDNNEENVDIFWTEFEVEKLFEFAVIKFVLLLKVNVGVDEVVERCKSQLNWVWVTWFEFEIDEWVDDGLGEIDNGKDEVRT